MTNSTIFPSVLEGYARRGWRCFPCHARGGSYVDRRTGEEREYKAKTPMIPAWPQAATADPAQIKRWLAKYPRAMWAAATGTASGFFAVDLDRHEGADGVEALRAYMREHDLAMPKTLTQRTAGGGMHLLFSMPEGADIRNAAGILPGVDTRGDGGYIIIPPSVNEETGAAYQWTDPDAPIADAPAWLVELVSKKDKGTSAPDAKAPQDGAQAAYSGGGTAYGLRALRDEIGTLRAAEQGARNDTLNRCAVKLFALAAGGELDADIVQRELEAAASAIGLTYAESAATMASAKKAGYASPRKAPEQRADTAQEAQTPDAWEQPIDFEEHELPALDTALLPPLLKAYVEGLAEALQVPPELPCAMGLAAVSTATQWRFMVLIRTGYREPLNTYVLCPLDPGNRKSATVAAVTDPLRIWERTQKERLDPIIKEAKSRRLTMEKAIAAKREKAAKATAEGREAMQREIEELEDNLPAIPLVPRLLADNVTPEALAVLMAEMRECMAILTAEGGIFDILAGLYSQKTPNLDLFLKAHSGGDSFRVDRRNAPPVILDDPLLTMGISPQPVTLAERSASRIFRARGLDGRFLYFLPKSLLGRRRMEPRPLDPAIKAAWERKILDLLPVEWTDDAPEKTDLILSDAAYRAWLDFSERVERELADDGEFSAMTDWGGKLPGAVARIAGLFHLLTEDAPERDPISAETMARAISMGAFLTEHAKAAYALMGSDEALEGAKMLLEWIRRTAAETFSTQQIWQAKRGYFKRMDPLREALRVLEERNYIREAPQAKAAGPGRPSGPSYLVNPLALRG